MPKTKIKLLYSSSTKLSLFKWMKNFIAYPRTRTLAAVQSKGVSGQRLFTRFLNRFTVPLLALKDQDLQICFLSRLIFRLIDS